MGRTALEKTRARFDELVGLAPGKRAEGLAPRGDADPESRDVIASLLPAHARTSGVLGSPAAPTRAHRADHRQDPFGLVGKWVAHFQILEPLGRAGWESCTAARIPDF